MTARHQCRMDGKTVRCSCGGQVMVEGSLHPLADLGFGFKGGKFVVEAKHNMKKVVGYSGICMKCRKQGQFVLE